MCKQLATRLALLITLTTGATGAVSLTTASPASASASCSGSTHNHLYGVQHYIKSVKPSGRYNIVTWHTTFWYAPKNANLFYDRHYTTLWCLVR